MCRVRDMEDGMRLRLGYTCQLTPRFRKNRKRSWRRQTEMQMGTRWTMMGICFWARRKKTILLRFSRKRSVWRAQGPPAKNTARKNGRKHYYRPYRPTPDTDACVRQPKYEEQVDETHPSSTIDQQEETDNAQDPTVWNEGRLMTLLNVDPALFGWNDENEDWE